MKESDPTSPETSPTPPTTHPEVQGSGQRRFGKIPLLRNVLRKSRAIPTPDFNLGTARDTADEEETIIFPRINEDTAIIPAQEAPRSLQNNDIFSNDLFTSISSYLATSSPTLEQATSPTTTKQSHNKELAKGYLTQTTPWEQKGGILEKTRQQLASVINHEHSAYADRMIVTMAFDRLKQAEAVQSARRQAVLASKYNSLRTVAKMTPNDLQEVNGRIRKLQGEMQMITANYPQAANLDFNEQTYNKFISKKTPSVRQSFLSNRQRAMRIIDELDTNRMILAAHAGEPFLRTREARELNQLYKQMSGAYIFSPISNRAAESQNKSKNVMPQPPTAQENTPTLYSEFPSFFDKGWQASTIEAMQEQFSRLKKDKSVESEGHGKIYNPAEYTAMKRQFAEQAVVSIVGSDNTGLKPELRAYLVSLFEKNIN